jgi:hypothetical protein
MKFFDTIRRRLALRSYVKILGPELLRRFGKRRFYSPEHVIKAAHARALDPTHLPYAYAMFCSRETYTEYAAKMGDLLPRCNFDALRAEVGDRLLGSSLPYSAEDVFEAYSISHDHSGSDSDSSADAHHD